MIPTPPLPPGPHPLIAAPPSPPWKCLAICQNLPSLPVTANWTGIQHPRNSCPRCKFPATPAIALLVHHNVPKMSTNAVILAHGDDCDRKSTRCSLRVSLATSGGPSLPAHARSVRNGTWRNVLIRSLSWANASKQNSCILCAAFHESLKPSLARFYLKCALPPSLPSSASCYIWYLLLLYCPPTFAQGSQGRGENLTPPLANALPHSSLFCLPLLLYNWHRLLFGIPC